MDEVYFGCPVCRHPVSEEDSKPIRPGAALPVFCSVCKKLVHGKYLLKDYNQTV